MRLRYRARDRGECGRLSGDCCEIIDLPEEPWPLLARSGGEPIEVFGEWTPRGFRPLSLLG